MGRQRSLQKSSRHKQQEHQALYTDPLVASEGSTLCKEQPRCSERGPAAGASPRSLSETDSQARRSLTDSESAFQHRPQLSAGMFKFEKQFPMATITRQEGSGRVSVSHHPFQPLRSLLRHPPNSRDNLAKLRKRRGRKTNIAGLPRGWKRAGVRAGARRRPGSPAEPRPPRFSRAEVPGGGHIPESGLAVWGGVGRGRGPRTTPESLSPHSICREKDA